MSNTSNLTKYNSIVEKRNALQSEVLECAPLISTLKEFAAKDAVYFPSAGNFGDGLIGLGTLCLFETIGVNPRVHDILSESPVPEASHIIVGGGGGWLDGLWNHYATILEGFFEKGGQALILPSTVKGFDSFFEKYASQITIFARERVSFDHLNAIKGLEGRVYLCHDLAFATDFSLFKIYGPDQRSGSLNLFREDEEARNASFYTHNYDLSLLWNSLSWFDKETCVRRLLPLVTLMSQFEEIHSDRLHMSILGTLIGCTVTMHPSGYFKNKAVYDYSLSRFNNVTFTCGKPEDNNAPGSVSIVRDPQDKKDLEWFADNQATQSEKYRILNEELQATRERNLIYANQLDEITRKLNGQFGPRYNGGMEAYFNSRGYRLWNKYNRLYEHERIGPYLRKIRSMAGRILRRLGIMK